MPDNLRLAELQHDLQDPRDGKAATSMTLPATGDWGAFTTVPMGSVSLPPGRHEVTLVWEGRNAAGCGNLKDVEFVRE